MWRKMSSWARKVMPALRASLYSVSDPTFASLFGYGYSGQNYSGVQVTEGSALGMSGVWRAVNLISGTLATLPLRTMRDTGDGMRQRMASFLDSPGLPIGLTPFNWTEMVYGHLLLHGNAFLKHINGGAGQILGLQPIHPHRVSVRLPQRGDSVQPKGGKWFDVMLDDGTHETHDSSTLTHVMRFSLDGITGLSPISVARNSLGTGIAGDRAAARVFDTGAMVSGIISPEDDLGFEDAAPIKASITNAMTGYENAGGIAVINTRLKFQQISSSAKDAQFLESRQFSIEEVARWFGVPPFALMQMDKQSSWAASVEGQQKGLARTVLAPWAKCLEEALSALLYQPRFVEFDFTGLERPTPEAEIDLLIKQVDAGLLTLNEARAIRNMPPVEGGNVVRGVQAAASDPATDITEAVPSA